MHKNPPKCDTSPSEAHLEKDDVARREREGGKKKGALNWLFCGKVWPFLCSKEAALRPHVSTLGVPTILHCNNFSSTATS